MTRTASRLSDPAHVREQYRDGERLEARSDLYARFGSAREPWYRWLFARIAPAPGERVLDAGCGLGGLWSANRDRLPPGLRVLLVDRSPGMAREAAARLGPLADLRAVGDLRRLPLREASLDRVAANHVLYHVEDPAAAVRELARVLRPGGLLAVATNDATHLRELREVAARFGAPARAFAVGRDPAAFDLESAAEAVRAELGSARVERRRDRLRITDPGAVVGYVRTLLPAGAGRDALEALGSHVAEHVARRGAFQTVACGGVVLAERRG